jgi:hypothetical protein
MAGLAFGGPLAVALTSANFYLVHYERDGDDQIDYLKKVHVLIIYYSLPDTVLLGSFPIGSPLHLQVILDLKSIHLVSPI